VSSLDDDSDSMHLESGSSIEEMSEDAMDSNCWNEIESELDEEFMEDHGLVEEVTSASEDNTVHPIDCYRHFITEEIIDLMVRETNRYAEQFFELMRLPVGPNFVNENQPLIKRCSSFLESLSRWGWYKCRN
jgi:hypothetical protein